MTLFSSIWDFRADLFFLTKAILAYSFRVSCRSSMSLYYYRAFSCACFSFSNCCSIGLMTVCVNHSCFLFWTSSNCFSLSFFSYSMAFLLSIAILSKTLISSLICSSWASLLLAWDFFLFMSSCYCIAISLCFFFIDNLYSRSRCSASSFIFDSIALSAWTSCRALLVAYSSCFLFISPSMSLFFIFKSFSCSKN